MLGAIFERTICFNILQESPNMLVTIFNSPSSVHNFAAFACTIGDHLTGSLICLLDDSESFKIYGILK